MFKYTIEFLLIILGIILFGFIAPFLISIKATELNILGLFIIIIYLIGCVWFVEKKYIKIKK